MQTSQKGIELMKGLESCVLTAYPDSGTGSEHWTIGFGHSYHVQKGNVITAATDEQFLMDDLKIPELSINTNVKVVLTQNQFDARVSFVFNVSSGSFTRSTLLKKRNAGDYAGAADAFLKWVNANGKKLSGLVKRRTVEYELS